MEYPHFSATHHINNVISKPYFRNLILLRDLIEKSCDIYFASLGAPRVNLYLISKSVSSPIGLGSDSVPIDFNLGSKKYYLSDSSQFGMEPLIMNSFDIVYCYLPSFRGENPDERHLNQFYHCEAELRGDYKKAMGIAEDLVKYILKSVKKNIDKKVFHFMGRLSSKTFDYSIHNKFKVVTFDEAVAILKKNGQGKLVLHKKYGRVLTREAETSIVSAVTGNKAPVWVTHYDRDTVAFYQKPDNKNNGKVLNADLIFPPRFKGTFGGEIIGLGQRQDNIKEIKESIKRQKIVNSGQYDWYIKLRENPRYRTTAGFGLGVERLIAWMLGLTSIADASLYPVLKNTKTVF